MEVGCWLVAAGRLDRSGASGVPARAGQIQITNRTCHTGMQVYDSVDSIRWSRPKDDSIY